MTVTFCSVEVQEARGSNLELIVVPSPGVPTRQELYGQQHLGRYYHGPGEGQLIPPIPDVDDKDFVYGPKNEPPPYKGVSATSTLFFDSELETDSFAFLLSKSPVPALEVGYRLLGKAKGKRKQSSSGKGAPSLSARWLFLFFPYLSSFTTIPL